MTIKNDSTFATEIKLFATELRLLELKYGFYLGGDRAGNIKVFDKNGKVLKVLPNIQISTPGNELQPQ